MGEAAAANVFRRRIVVEAVHVLAVGRQRVLRRRRSAAVLVGRRVDQRPLRVAAADVHAVERV